MNRPDPALPSSAERGRLPLCVVADAYGPPSSFRLAPTEIGAPGPGRLRMAIRAAGVSFVDVLVAAGRYQVQPPLPFIPGSEFAGVVDAVGPGVDPGLLGRRVCAVGFGMAFGEAAVVPVADVIAIPDAMSFEAASVFRVSYATVYNGLVQRARLQAGEHLLVMGAAGAIGLAAIQLGRAFGANVIASASTAEKRRAASAAGAHHVVDARSETWRADVKAATGGSGLDVVLDPIGGASTEAAFRSLRWGGRHLVVGFAEGTIPKLPTNLALLKGGALLGVDVRQMGMFEPEVAADNLRRLFELYEQGHVDPVIARTYDLRDFAAAMDAAQTGASPGRIVLTM